jgi:hypothetical protein
MMTDRTASPLLPACKLWEKTSASGNTYLVGRMGGVRVLVLQNNRPEGDSDATHVLMFTEAAPMQPRPSPETLSRPAPAPRRTAPPLRRSGDGRHAPTHRIEDDGIPF